MSKTRIQLTLFVDENESMAIEETRKKFNPEQYELIKSHVTLCREDELEQIDKVVQTLATLNHTYVTIDFGPVTRFADGKGVLLPAAGNPEQFHALRNIILKQVIKNPETPIPHITLMHPRNTTCTDSLFNQIERIKLPTRLTFKKISLIKQEPGKKWNILKEFNLLNTII